jgi:hypothetical protein
MSASIELGDYMRAIREYDSVARKTEVWIVKVTRDDSTLGRIAWLGRWRQYTFEPMTGTVFNNSCLRSLVEFLDRLNAEHAVAIQHSTSRSAPT